MKSLNELQAKSQPLPSKYSSVSNFIEQQGIDPVVSFRKYGKDTKLSGLEKGLQLDFLEICEKLDFMQAYRVSDAITMAMYDDKSGSSWYLYFDTYILNVLGADHLINGANPYYMDISLDNSEQTVSVSIELVSSGDELH